MIRTVLNGLNVSTISYKCFQQSFNSYLFACSHYTKSKLLEIQMSALNANLLTVREKKTPVGSEGWN